MHKAGHSSTALYRFESLCPTCCTDQHGGFPPPGGGSAHQPAAHLCRHPVHCSAAVILQRHGSILLDIRQRQQLPRGGFPLLKCGLEIWPRSGHSILQVPQPCGQYTRAKWSYPRVKWFTVSTRESTP